MTWAVGGCGRMDGLDVGARLLVLFHVPSLLDTGLDIAHREVYERRAEAVVQETDLAVAVAKPRVLLHLERFTDERPCVSVGHHALV